MSYGRRHRYHDFEDEEVIDTKEGGVVFNSSGGGATTTGNTVNKVTININLTANGLTSEDLEKLKLVLNEIKTGVPALGAPDPQKKKKLGWIRKHD